MASTRFSESHGIMPLTIDGDWNAGFSSDSFDMSKYNHATLLVIGDDSCAGNGIITIYGGAADAEETAAITFTYRYSSADVAVASSDIFGAAATSAALTTTVASIKNQVTVIEFDAEDLYVSNVQYRYVTVVVDATGSAGTVSIIAILSEPRYSEAVMDTANPA
jgi:hypothetical protein